MSVLRSSSRRRLEPSLKCASKTNVKPLKESDASSEQDVEILCFANKTLKPSSSAFFLFFIILLNYTSYSHIHAAMIFLL